MDGKIKGINSREKAKEIFADNYNKIKSNLLKHEKTNYKIR